ncbi:MAG TPA: hypothetical protein VGM56_02480 [Byssovorax sp.]|nr:hypothetical protein [Polyangia bacterium]
MTSSPLFIAAFVVLTASLAGCSSDACESCCTAADSGALVETSQVGTSASGQILVAVGESTDGCDPGPDVSLAWDATTDAVVIGGDADPIQTVMPPDADGAFDFPNVGVTITQTADGAMKTYTFSAPRRGVTLVDVVGCFATGSGVDCK